MQSQLQLYVHTKKPDWGLAVLAWERDGRRAYQFQDGELRIIKDGYYELMEEREINPREAAQVVAGLRQLAGLARQRRKATREARVSGESLITIDQQVELFGELYPGGFKGEKWQKEFRSDDRPRKRHRTPALAKAAEVLSEEALGDLVDNHQWAKAAQAIADVLKMTDLSTASRNSSLTEMQSKRQALLVWKLLYGEEPLTERIDSFAAHVADWQVCTTLLALVRPQDDVPVRVNIVREQARWMAPELELSKTVNGTVYQGTTEMAQVVRVMLEERKLVPADLIDVSDFMGVTLRLDSRKQIIAKAKAKAAPKGDAAEAGAAEAAVAE